MKIGTMLGETLRSVFRKPATGEYPFTHREVPQRLRGTLVFNPEKCTGCMLCVKDCPSDAIEIVAVDKPNKRFVMRFHADRCTYCAQCVVNCHFHCLEMSNTEWERAALKRGPFMVLQGREEDVAKVKAGPAPAIPAVKP